METAPSTIKQQRSFTADWLVSGDPQSLPQGVIVDLSIITLSASPVYLGRLAIIDGILSISLEQGGKICAYGEIKGDGVTGNLKVSGAVVSATITTGSLSNLSEVVYSPDRAQISPDLVTVVGNMDEGITTVTIIQDGEETVYTLNEDTELAVSNNLELLYDNITGEAIISMSEEDYAAFVQLSLPLISEPSTLISINNVKSNTGILSITIETDGTRLPVDSNNGTGLLKIDGSDIVLCGARESIIDSKISPALHVSGYKPLDDMYNKSTGVRDPLGVVSLQYGIMLGSELKSTLALTEVDPEIDCEQESL